MPPPPKPSPFYLDDARPFAQRSDGMSLDIVRPKDIPRGKIMYPKDESSSLKTDDIPTCKPTYPHLNYLQKPDYSTGCTEPDHVGGRARTYYPPMERRPRDLSLTTADIEYAQSKNTKIKGNRHTDPVCPRYELASCHRREPTPPRFHGRHTNDISDIELSHPKKVIPDRNYMRNPNDASDIEYASSNYQERYNAATRRPLHERHDRSLNVTDISGEKKIRLRCTNPLDPSYKVPTHSTTSLHARYSEEQGARIQGSDRVANEIGHVHGSKPRKLQWDNGEPHFSLLREDIAGTVPQRWVGCVPANIYDHPEARPMISFHDPHDIPGSQVGSLKKGIEGSTRRQLNPLNPSYTHLDGSGGPHPHPIFEAERGHAHATHPGMHRMQASASAPNLHRQPTPQATPQGQTMRRDQSDTGLLHRSPTPHVQMPNQAYQPPSVRSGASTPAGRRSQREVLQDAVNEGRTLHLGSIPQLPDTPAGGASLHSRRSGAAVQAY